MDDEDFEIIMEDGDDFTLDDGEPVTTKSKTKGNLLPKLLSK